MGIQSQVPCRKWHRHFLWTVSEGSEWSMREVVVVIWVVTVAFRIGTLLAWEVVATIWASKEYAWDATSAWTLKGMLGPARRKL